MNVYKVLFLLFRSLFVSGAISRTANPDADKEVGQELDFTVRYDHSDNLEFMAGYSHFFNGDFLNNTGPADDADWVSAKSGGNCCVFSEVCFCLFLDFVCKLLFGVSVSPCSCWPCDFAAMD